MVEGGRQGSINMITVHTAWTGKCRAEQREKEDGKKERKENRFFHVLLIFRLQEIAKSVYTYIMYTYM